MTDIQVKIDERAFRGELTVFKRQIPFATAKAINYTAIDAQKALRRHMEQAFIVRRKPFVLNSVKIKPFANKETLTATVKIDPPGGPSRDVLSQHQQWFTKKPVSGKSVAIPLPALRPDVKKVIPTAKRPKNLKNAYKHTDKDTGITYLMQRVGRGKNAVVKPLYELRAAVKVKPRFQFAPTATEAVNKTWNANFNRAWNEAIATALK